MGDFPANQVWLQEGVCNNPQKKWLDTWKVWDIIEPPSWKHFSACFLGSLSLSLKIYIYILYVYVCILYMYMYVYIYVCMYIHIYLCLSIQTHSNSIMVGFLLIIPVYIPMRIPFVDRWSFFIPWIAADTKTIDQYPFYLLQNDHLCNYHPVPLLHVEIFFSYRCTGRFPKMGVPPNHPDWFLKHLKPVVTSGSPILGNLHI